MRILTFYTTNDEANQPFSVEEYDETDPLEADRPAQLAALISRLDPGNEIRIVEDREMSYSEVYSMNEAIHCPDGY
jgi:hypothetical protein